MLRGLPPPASDGDQAHRAQPRPQRKRGGFGDCGVANRGVEGDRHVQGGVNSFTLIVVLVPPTERLERGGLRGDVIDGCAGDQPVVCNEIEDGSAEGESSWFRSAKFGA